MPGVAVFAHDLSVFSPERARALSARLHTETGKPLEAVYALVWPDYPAGASPVPQANRVFFREWAQRSGVPLWAWLNAQQDQAADAQAIKGLDATLAPWGWLLDIEGEWTKGGKLSTLISAARATGRRVRASLAGQTPAHVEYDYRTLDANNVEVDWQAYMDSGEGCWPAVAVAELYRTSFVIGGWQYRHHIRGTYGWGKVGRVTGGVAHLDSYMHPGIDNATFEVSAGAWGWRVEGDGRLWRDDDEIGVLMGRARYANVRVTLDVTRGHDQARTLEEWTRVAASARAPGAAKRPVSVYLADSTTDDVIVAIARGAA